MAEIVSMPKMSDTMTEGVIAAWHKKVGDKIQSGELMAEIETDKATMEYESYHDGTLLYIGAEVGEAVAVNGILAIVGKPGEDYKALLNGGSSKAEVSEAKPAAKEEAPASKPAEKVDVSGIKAQIVRMPKMSDTMTVGTIAAWLKKVGDKVKSGDILAEVETDKATMELENYEDGTLLYVGCEDGGSVPVDGVLAIVGEEGADYKKLLQAEEANSKPASAPKAEEAKPATESAPKTEEAKPVAKQALVQYTSSDDSRVKASPLARQLAKEKGINLNDVNGSGPNGRVIKADVETFTPKVAKATGGSVVATVGAESSEEIPMNSMRKAIARNLTASQFGAPHFYLTMDIDMDNAIAARKSINDMGDAKVSFNDIVVKAVAASLRKHPLVNSTVTDSAVIKHQHIHVGVAVAIPDGLVVPVIKHTDALSLSQISSAVKDLAGRAKDKKLAMDEMQGATFTISNLGMFGIEQFTSIINAPASCIMAIGGIKQIPVVKNGQIVPGNVMKVTMTCDHRSVDGAIGAAFLQTFKILMEDPIRMLA